MPAMSLPAPTEPDRPEHYINRELSLLAFHRRVLEQAKDPDTPLLERLRFLTISSTNLDEFYEVRVARLKQQMALGIGQPGPDRLSPQETFLRVSAAAQDLVEEQYRVLNDVLLPALASEGISIPRRQLWSPELTRWAKAYFESSVLPVLTPVGLDPAHPFPEVLNKSLNFIVKLEGEDAFERDANVAVLQVPRVVPRLIPVPTKLAPENTFVLLSSIIHANVGQLFEGMEIQGCYQFRVTRNSDLWVNEEDVEDLLDALKGELHSRNYGAAVRLEMPADSDPEMQALLLEEFGLGREDLFLVEGPVNLHRLSALHGLVDRSDLKYVPFIPRLPKAVPQHAHIFDLVRRQDVLLHHPYQSFSPVLELIRRAASDPKVLAIKQTVYRTGEHSSVAEALLEAARAGKEVTAVVELRARFDEAANIDLATRLQEVGAKVAYGIVGYKTHAKMLLVVRREGDTLRRYAHLGTGNYHPVTAKVYTDIGFITADPDITADVDAMFHELTGLGKARKLRKLLQAPFTLHKTMLRLIEEEAKQAAKGKPARIIAKMNALVEPQIVRALYAASQAGVEIDLIVRGICVLRPGVPGLSETIRVRSIVGRFLEHSRVFYFHAGGQELYYCGSADWMGRNFFRRVETCFPVEAPPLKKKLHKALQAYLKDERQAWILGPDGEYARPPVTSDLRSAQVELLARLSDDPQATAAWEASRGKSGKRKRRSRRRGA
ncbi:MAG: polyphosphate kinase 1 [Planctomycetota bacterium]|nr:MAG: polyphosphate kinase 1 [Planctomycetota bacterium]